MLPTKTDESMEKSLVIDGNYIISADNHIVMGDDYIINAVN